MTYLSTPAVSPLYDVAESATGYVPNYTRVFALHPEVYVAWQELSRAVAAGMDRRRYELVTLAAARRLGSAYCTLAHAAVLREQFYDDAALCRIVADRHHAPLDPADVAIMDFAELIAGDPGAVTAANIDDLRRHGLVDIEVFQVVLAVCLRRFFSGVLSAAGAQPDAVYDALDPYLRARLATP